MRRGRIGGDPLAAGKSVAACVSAFGATAKAKLSRPAIDGAPEDQLRGPLETLIRELAELDGLPGAITLIGETTLKHLKTRPDFAVSVQNALVGFIKIKAPGKGADPRKFAKDSHDGEQWEKLKSLPNLLYTDGNAVSLWRDGKLEDKILQFGGNIETAGTKLEAPDGLEALISSFLHWAPIPPKTAKGLAEVSARLGRDEARFAWGLSPCQPQALASVCGRVHLSLE